jgi:hypothetical protein
VLIRGSVVPSWFSVDSYVQLNPDAVSYVEGPLAHFIDHGRFEGRRFV